MNTAAADNPPRKLGAFEVLREIGQGGMGIIYLARQPSLDRYVVLKRIRRDLLSDESVVQRFQYEAQAAAAVQHQNVVAVYDCFSHRGRHYIAQELVDGLDLRSILPRVGRLDPSVAALVALEVARGLEEIHLRGIVHRDVKPANILIGCGGETKITDFGIALGERAGGMTRPGTLLGSVPYMSPEQMQGRRVDARSDIFAFGVLLYETLTGSPPFTVDSDDDSLEPLLEAIHEQRYESARSRVPAVPRYLDRLIRSCLEPDPARRIQSAGEIRQTLEKRLGGIGSSGCRTEVATYFQGHDVLPRPGEGETTEVHPQTHAPRRKKRRQHHALVALLLGAMVLAYGAIVKPWEREAARRPLAVPAEPPAQADAAVPVASIRRVPVSVPVPVPVPAPEPALVRFAAYPWAEVSLSDGVSFHTPRAAPVSLPPGSHRVVFEHPRYGRAEYTFELEAGQERLLRHVFEEAPSP